MKNYIIIFIGLATFLSCGKKDAQIKQSIYNKKNNMNSIEKKDSVKKILERQIMSGYAVKERGLDAISDYRYTSEDYVESAELSYDILKRNGYQFPNEKDFQNKVKEIFSFNIVGKSLVNFLIEYPCSREKIAYQLDENYVISNNNPLFIDYKYKIISEAYFIPELINYKKDFPDIYKKENEIPKEKNVGSINQVEIIPWMSLKSLDEKRQLNIQKIINRNKYLFNNNKASLVWLKFNDKTFLESLVKTFGYTADAELLKFVLVNNYKNPDEFEKLLWNSKCNGDIVFNKDVLDLIAESTPENQNLYLNAISDYIIKEYNNSNSALSKNFHKKAEILGKIAYYSTKMDFSQNNYYKFFSILSIENGGIKYNEEFKKNNYYNISDFKDIWEETKNGGISYPGME